MEKKLLFSVTAADCKWSYTRGTGAGGQKKNKTSSAVHCTHEESGAHGYSEETRSQSKNRELAFVKMTKTKDFQAWHQMMCRRLSGKEAEINAKVIMELRRVKVEVKNEDGLWEVWKEDKQEC